MRKLHLLAGVATALALSACGTSNDTAAADANASENVAVDQDTAVESADANLAAPAAIPATAQEFADKAAASDMFEIESGKLAADKGQDAAVKEFAAMLVKDHTKSTADLKAAGAKASAPIVPAPALDAEQQANLDALKAASGADFDRLYVQQQIPAHEKALAMLQGYSAGGDVEAIKEFASKTAPVVQHHLEQARTLQR